ncbi:MAG: cytochrome bd-I oxidase subunit CydX [Alphaproteobacteria bacterium]|nr:cytochrome bd-I oxidase subunit CydX [Alphaproteobacteria bacterium]MBU1525185.1 cytochrome bd-I oxidase subunit CydX [Alphaproteobacteria bacterium]MBU2118386.1 cytochrome bd-I oxidase subunit CydX [Alphaproteobacteria bacterium]MBU2352181.1 cytochrome bd-I oxidase subunit CydX [Alphaproteobacteria bacterium]MBU2381191.1 cytochrome bd-I oxidase subunit CydX [Alphaproteobacteria bacterium]
MWYFAWILGLGLAVLFGVLNGLWHEFQLVDEGDDGASSPWPTDHDAV